MLKDFSAILTVDGLSTYESVAAGIGGKLSLVNCCMHVRRKYVECAEVFPQANEALKMIAELYAVDREYKEGPEDLERLLALRQQKSRPIAGVRPRPGNNVHEQPVDGADAVSDERAGAAGQRCNGAGHARPGDGPQEPLRQSEPARHRGSGALLQPAGDGEAVWGGVQALPARGGAGGPLRGEPIPLPYQLAQSGVG